ncbi:Crp/Fnr family transcriptional regulator [Listeria grandensis]|uniref:Cyclic nucleotide-binding protein n=2 Tax=Listeria grandensis TaxID=1494963 RepID=W7BHA9_9LIST|nr:helix-turn-helix domain-containing protein [Listeria grandensis]EUJ22641.1 cyclic nucleotide-binding protein [Listeria grandensis FSL F6-0971]MBC1473838.1 Crp/Fnr family transcriptional regulator [Listeria grandensis]MBC1936145.1 Crp/Fnr family transcriptional regulator [Listeria grandensis]MBC6316044.1 Crp/Fnr family transcriptional regulator [Listeria grandensis]
MTTITKDIDLQQILMQYHENNKYSSSMHVVNVKKGDCIWDFSSKSDMCLFNLEGIVYFEERIAVPAKEKSMLNAFLLFKNQSCDLDWLSIDENAEKKLIALSESKIMLVNKTFLNRQLENMSRSSEKYHIKSQQEMFKQLYQIKSYWMLLPAEQRVFEVIAWCITSSNTGILPNCITQEILAKLSNSSREYVNLILSKFKKQGIISLKPIVITKVI